MMKRNYLIPMVLAFSFLAYTCTQNESKEKNPTIEKEDDVFVYSQHAAQVPLDTAKEEISYYHEGLRMVPDSFSWDSSTATISYTAKVITEKDRNVVDDFVNDYKKDNPKATVFPFSDKESRATSYFVNKGDIEGVYNAMDKDNVNGVRIYMAAALDKVNSSHIFLGPAYADANGYIDYYMLNSNGEAYLLDLTTPCPKACSNGFTKPKN